METNQQLTDKPRIYVACLAAYNSGRLHGAWIDANQDAGAIRAEVAAMLKCSPIVGAEECAIHAFEGFEGAHVEEYAGLEQVAELAEFVAEHGRLGALVLAYFGDLSETREALTDRYHGCFATVADYMEELAQGCVQIPEFLARYIDYEAMAIDAELGGDILTFETAHDEVHVFSGH